MTLEREDAEQCVRCLVSGRVQGVFFRASTRDIGRELGLRGYARNLPDGRVEVLACGEPKALDRFKSWLWKGPTAARVDSVSCEPSVSEGLGDFYTR